MKPVSLAICLCLLSSLSLLGGCRNQPPKPSPEAPPTQASAGEATMKAEEVLVDEGPIAPPQEIELNAESLLAAQLTPQQLEQGWVRLFDGQSLYGWLVVGNADWQIAPEGVLRVTRGEKSFLCTSFQIPNYELQVDFRSDAKTNSGIFMRCGPQPRDVGLDCFELNIAPAENPFPTGSLVERKKVEPTELGDFDPTQWHTYLVRVSGNQVTVSLDGKLILQLDDAHVSPTGHISLQHNEGQVEFRNVLMRPLELTELKLGEDWEEDWTLSEKEPDTFKATPTEDGLQLTGGSGQLQSKQAFGNFLLQARYTLASPEVNSGIFFRCIPDALLDGYECQVNHAVVDGDPLRPLDAGAGAIFRRQPARVVMGDGSKPTYLTLLASGPQMDTWVNGVLVAEFNDTREPNENPRKGLRLEAGPIALQGHDATTDVTFQSLKIVEIAP
ncbi:MAG: DUF1080 domain-containing protein [Pirellulaceae bacterium]|nr:DUF1080 domain-containing protein [Pirellulaceae bacterium]